MTSGPGWGLASLAAALLLFACVERPAGPGPESAQEAEGPATGAEAAGPAAPAPSDEAALTAEEEAEVEAIVSQMLHRPSCNRVMGCPGAVALMQLGPPVAPKLVELLETAGTADGYWIIKLIELLGQLPGEEGRRHLEGLLGDPRWEVRLRAAQALGNLGDGRSRGAVEAALERQLQQAEDLAFRAALHFALTRLPGGDRAGHRAALLRLMPLDPASVARTPPMVLDILIELVRIARIPEALPGVRLAVLSDNRFVRGQALKTLGALQDTGGLPYALHALEDELPSLRREALDALQAITGIRTMTDPVQWRRWCERHDCEALPTP